MNLEAPLTIRSMIEPVIKRRMGQHPRARRSVIYIKSGRTADEKNLYSAAEMGRS